MATVNWSLQHKRDTAANWTANNPTLLAGQIGIETDGLATNPKFKVGDGTNNWNALPYFYGGALSAQNLSNVLGVGNSTSGNDLVLTDSDSIQVGTTIGRYIRYSPFTVNGGLELVGATGEHIILQDSGGIHIDTTKLILEQLTASRILSLNANKEVISSYNTTGSGTTLALSTSPTFTTDITTPKILTTGALAVDNPAGSNTLRVQRTSGTVEAIVTANSSGTFYGSSTVHSTFIQSSGVSRIEVLSSGQVNIGNYATPSAQRLVTIGQDTAFMSFGSLVGSTGNAVIYGGQATPSGTNYTFLLGANSTGINAPNGNIELNYASSTRYTFANNRIDFSPTTISTGTITNFLFNVSVASGQTASTEIPNLKVTGASKTWAAGAITTQRWNYFTANTAAFASASTITNSYGLYVEAATAGSNATITNNWALGTNGGIFLNGTANTVLGNAALATNATTGFLHVPSCAGTPTGVPTLFTGTIPVVVDSTNNRMYIYSGGAWVALN